LTAGKSAAIAVPGEARYANLDPAVRPGCDDRLVQGYDIIGDVHGCATELETLLAGLGYKQTETTGAYRHPQRSAIFVGDLIDRGPGQLQVLQTVKSMVESGSAQIVMGNHEFNAICYDTEHPVGSGEFLRPHTPKNMKQHKAFLEQVTGTQRTHYMEWFKTLPLWLDLGELRVVHACWHEESMRFVERELGGNRFTTLDQLVRASDEADDLYTAVEVLLKGPEISLVDHGQRPFVDEDGHRREEARIRWWNGSARTLREIAEMEGRFETEDGEAYPDLPDDMVPEDERSYTYSGTVPVFYGHYWRTGTPTQLRDWTTYSACVDFSAVKPGEALMAYRWSGESKVSVENYVATPSVAAQP
jgi:hypothetical protein